jgi:hypothetical protein
MLCVYVQCRCIDAVRGYMLSLTESIFKSLCILLLTIACLLFLFVSQFFKVNVMVTQSCVDDPSHRNHILADIPVEQWISYAVYGKLGIIYLTCVIIISSLGLIVHVVYRNKVDNETKNTGESSRESNIRGRRLRLLCSLQGRLVAIDTMTWLEQSFTCVS